MDKDLNNFIVLGIGNIVGWGELLMKKMKEYKIDLESTVNRFDYRYRYAS